jgi:hypothetical protein
MRTTSGDGNDLTQQFIRCCQGWRRQTGAGLGKDAQVTFQAPNQC